jgi:glucose/arabinose dehydrogenase
MPNVNLVVGNDGANVLSGGAGSDLIYGFDPNGPQSQVNSISAARVASGLNQPLFAGAPPGDATRLFIVEKQGQIKILDLTTGQMLAAPFLDITAQVASQSERGLLGLAFDPGFAQNGLFYVNMINSSNDTEIRRYQVSANPNLADPASASLVISIAQPPMFDNHKGGWLGFGPDGYLYAALGDGGSGGDPLNNAQNINSLLGKMLRLDVHGDDFPADPMRNYAIPADNPFVGVAGEDEIFALGLRNPWRDSFDRGLGDLYIADVGQGSWEEIDIGQLGANYGWRIFEGPARNLGDTPTGGSAVPPIYAYDHSVGASITGGYVYRGASDGLQGQYFFADFSFGKIFTLRFDGSSWVATERTSQITTDAGAISNPSSFGEDAAGNLYLVDFDGEIFRLTPNVASADSGDSLAGLGGNDLLFGGSGDDVLDGGAGSDTLNGGNGFDRASYVQAPTGVVVNLGNPALNTNEATGDQFISIEGVNGSAFPDVITGDGNANDLRGLGGNDTLNGSNGADSLAGGGGADKFVFEAAAFAQAQSGVFDRVTDYDQSGGSFSAAEGDQLDLSAILSSVFNGSGNPDGVLVRAVASGIGADLQIDADGALNGVSWTTTAHLDGIHAGNTVNVILNGAFPAGSTITVRGSTPPNDFGGDAKSDILWQNDNGQAHIWSMNSTAVVSQQNAGTNPGPSWHAVDDADFDGNGKADILWQNDSSQAAIWLMNGSTQVGGGTVGPIPGTAWHIKTAGDFDGDGKADILWQNDSGQAHIWFMNGTSIVSPLNAGSNPGPSWQVKAAADFNGDGMADILWQNDNGQAAIWLMNGANVMSGPIIGANPGTSWHVKSAGDFDGDGKADILWQNDNGQAHIWFMNSTTIVSQLNAGSNPGPSWNVQDTSDFNADGKADILWQRDNGQAAIWLMNGATVMSGPIVGASPGTAWDIIA